MSLAELRQQIDAIDTQVLALLNERVQLASQVGRLKHAEGRAIFVPSREEEVFRKLLAQNGGPLGERSIRAIYRQVISAAIALEKRLVVAYLGPEATFTHQAALQQFGESLDYLPLGSIPEVFATVQHGEADYGVVPIENSTDGAVGIRSLDLLVETDLKIVAQNYLRISHCLASQSDLAAIREVHSKDNALGQCRQWLSRHLPHARMVEIDSTAVAVQRAAEAPTVAAVASPIAAERYGVPIQYEDIQDRTDNITRFLIIGRECSPPTQHGNDRTSLVFSLHDKPGALLTALQIFSYRGLNLMKIESRPSRAKLWDYYFYVDIAGHHDDGPVQEVLTELHQHCPMVKWLGSYPNANQAQAGQLTD